MNKIEALIYTGVGVAGVGVGFTVGYSLSKKRHEAIADAEIESVKETYSKAKENLIKPDLEEVVPESTVVVASESVKIIGASVDPNGLGYIAPTEELGTEAAPVEKVTNVFTKYSDAHDGVAEVEVTVDNDDPVELTVQLSKESPDKPYLISIDDFHDSTWDKHTKLSATYFVTDNVLIDEREDIIPNIEETIGKWALSNFGNLSLDPEVVYVRNQKLHADFEVTRDESSYQEQILGLKS